VSETNKALRNDVDHKPAALLVRSSAAYVSKVSIAFSFKQSFFKKKS
jgi:hypothetical protein